MAGKPPRSDPVQDAPQVTEPKHAAAGLPAIGHTLRIAQQQMGVRRTTLTLLRVNQKDDSDCPGCAWPEPEHRHAAEFCENGAKAVTEEATLCRVTPDFFAAHTLADLATRSGYWLGQQGRLTHPMYLAQGADHYEPVPWERAFDIVAEELAALGSPDEALLETIGIGKGSVLLEDLYTADLIIVAGQNPGTNHPRMLSAREKAKANGAKIITVNPLPEAGLERFKNPQTAQGMLKGAALTDLFLQIRLGGDQALFRLLNKLILEAEGTVDEEFVSEHTHGFEDFAETAHAADWDQTVTGTGLGLTRDRIDEALRLILESRRTIVCWAMGLTQHKHAVPTSREVVNDKSVVVRLEQSRTD